MADSLVPAWVEELFAKKTILIRDSSHFVLWRINGGYLTCNVDVPFAALVLVGGNGNADDSTVPDIESAVANSIGKYHNIYWIDSVIKVIIRDHIDITDIELINDVVNQTGIVMSQKIINGIASAIISSISNRSAAYTPKKKRDELIKSRMGALPRYSHD
jgi:hypothetical protein